MVCLYHLGHTKIISTKDNKDKVKNLIHETGDIALTVLCALVYIVCVYGLCSEGKKMEQ